MEVVVVQTMLLCKHASWCHMRACRETLGKGDGKTRAEQQRASEEKARADAENASPEQCARAYIGTLTTPTPARPLIGIRTNPTPGGRMIGISTPTPAGRSLLPRLSSACFCTLVAA